MFDKKPRKKYDNMVYSKNLCSTIAFFFLAARLDEE